MRITINTLKLPLMAVLFASTLAFITPSVAQAGSDIGYTFEGSIGDPNSDFMFYYTNPVATHDNKLYVMQRAEGAHNPPSTTPSQAVLNVYDIPSNTLLSTITLTNTTREEDCTRNLRITADGTIHVLCATYNGAGYSYSIAAYPAGSTTPSTVTPLSSTNLTPFAIFAPSPSHTYYYTDGNTNLLTEVDAAGTIIRTLPLPAPFTGNPAYGIIAQNDGTLLLQLRIDSVAKFDPSTNTLTQLVNESVANGADFSTSPAHATQTTVHNFATDAAGNIYVLGKRQHYILTDDSTPDSLQIKEIKECAVMKYSPTGTYIGCINDNMNYENSFGSGLPAYFAVSSNGYVYHALYSFKSDPLAGTVLRFAPPAPVVPEDPAVVAPQPTDPSAPGAPDSGVAQQVPAALVFMALSLIAISGLAAAYKLQPMRRSVRSRR